MFKSQILLRKSMTKAPSHFISFYFSSEGSSFFQGGRFKKKILYLQYILFINNISITLLGFEIGKITAIINTYIVQFY